MTEFIALTFASIEANRASIIVATRPMPAISPASRSIASLSPDCSVSSAVMSRN
jgi:hypothetical protein